MKKPSSRSKKPSVRDIPVVILCGGKGTRLREETLNIPKPLVSIGERPILWHIMKIYYAQGFRRFILLLGYKGEKIKEYFLNYPYYSSSFTLKPGRSPLFHTKPEEKWEITFLDTGLETQTGGRIKQLEKILKKEKSFMLTYGDGVANIDLAQTLRSHIANKSLVTMTGVPPLARFGEIREGEQGSWRFFEKPVASDILINGGFFVIETRLLKAMSEDPLLNFESDVLPELARTDDLNICAHTGYWQCMDTLRDSETLNTLWENKKSPWKIW